MPAAEPLLYAGLSQHPADFSEPRLTCQCGQLIDRPAERRRHLVIEGLYRPACGFEEGSQKVTAGGQHPGELGEIRRQLPWQRMNDGIPGHDAAQYAISQPQGIHRPDLKAEARMRAAGKIDHGRRQIQAEHVQPKVPQVSCNPPGPASKLSDKPAARSTHILGERGQQRPVQRQIVKLIPDEVGIAGSDSIIGLGRRSPA